jgi:hypothetical protein
VRFSQWIALSSAFLLVSPTYGQRWIEYLDRSQFFGINFPGAPDVEDIIYTSGTGVDFPARVYTAQDGDSIYKVTIVDFTEAERLHAEREDRTSASSGEWLKDVRGSVAHAAWNFRRRGGEVTYDAWSDIERVEGHQLQMTNEDQSRTFVGIYLHNGRLHILDATVPPGWPPPMHFQQSLRFFDEDGVRVRYELDINGNTTRIPGSYEYDGGRSEVIERKAN